MKRIIIDVSAILILLLLAGCVDAGNRAKAPIIKEECTVEQFIALYAENNKDSRKILHSGEVSHDGTWRDYQVVDITPANVYDEIGCRIFKIIYDQTYVVFKGKLYPIGGGVGGFGVVDINTCDFDNDKQKDIIYSFSHGSGIHRSRIAQFSFTAMEETHFEFANMNSDMMLEKISDNEYKVYDAGIKDRLNEIYHFNKGRLLLTVKSVNNQPVIENDKKGVTARPRPSIGIPEETPHVD